jgi:hypothetical protein
VDPSISIELSRTTGWCHQERDITVFDKNPKTELAPNFSPKPEKNEKPSPKWAKP